MDKLIYELMDNKRSKYEIETAKIIVFYEVLYTLCVQFKKELEYLREPHLITSYLDKINFDLLKENPALEELTNQLETFGINHEYFNDLNIESDLEILEQVDFSKDIIRGNYKEVFNKFKNVQSVLFKTSSRLGGVYPTPNPITQILKGSLDVQIGETLMDPCYGTGLMALDIGENASQVFGQELLMPSFLFGKINSIVSNKDHRIEFGDSLLNLKVPKADVVLSNSPFGVRFNPEKEPDYLHWGKPSKAGGDFHFISLVLNNMNDRGAIIVPEGVLFKGGREGDIRKKIIEDNFVEAVISLPANLFPDTPIATSILIFNKNKLNDHILLIDAKELFVKVRGGVEVTDDHINQIINLFKGKLEMDELSKKLSLDEIANNDYILTVNRYITKKSEVEDLDLNELSIKVINLESEIEVLRNHTNELVRVI